MLPNRNHIGVFSFCFFFVVEASILANANTKNNSDHKSTTKKKLSTQNATAHSESIKLISEAVHICWQVRKPIVQIKRGERTATMSISIRDKICDTEN